MRIGTVSPGYSVSRHTRRVLRVTREKETTKAKHHIKVTKRKKNQTYRFGVLVMMFFFDVRARCLSRLGHFHNHLGRRGTGAIRCDLMYCVRLVRSRDDRYIRYLIGTSKLLWVWVWVWVYVRMQDTKYVCFLLIEKFLKKMCVRVSYRQLTRDSDDP